jgi:hypothetical protein
MQLKVFGSIAVSLVLCASGMAQPAYAAWTWKSALLWSYSAADCTAPPAAVGSGKMFRFGNTAVSVNCGTAGANASASNGFGGGVGNGFANPGSFGPFEVDDASAAISAPSFTVGTTSITFNGTATASESGANDEIGAFLFTGDPNAIFGPPGSETIPPTDIEGLISLGVISASDVLVDLDNAQIPSSFTSLSFNQVISPSQEGSVVLAAFAEGAAVPEPGTLALLGTALLGLIGLRRGRPPPEREDRLS